MATNESSEDRQRNPVYAQQRMTDRPLYGKVVAGYEENERGEEALMLARRVVARDGGELNVVHVEKGSPAATFEALAERGALRPGLDLDTATDIIWALASPQLYRLLTVDRKWSTERWGAWLSESLTIQLLTRQTLPPGPSLST